MASACLPLSAEQEMIELGISLSDGEPPERTFALCLKALEQLKDDYGRMLAKNGRLYPTAGFAVGCLIVILLL